MADFNEQTLRFGDDNFESENKNMMSSNGNIRFGGFDDDDQSQSRGVNDAPAAKTVQSDASATPNMQQNQQPAKPKPQGVKKPAAAQPSAPVQPTVSTTPPGFGKKNLQIKLIVINNSGVVLNRYTVNQKEVTNDQTLTFQEERSSYDLIIGAEGYKDRRIQVTQTDLVRGEKRVTLATQLQRLTVSFNTPEGLKRGEIEIDMTNPVYKYIKDADHTDTPLNMLQIDGVGGKVLPTGGRLSPWPYVIALCVGIVIGILVASMFSCGGGSNDTVDPSAPVAETTTEEVSSEDIAPEAEPTLAPSPIVEQTEPEEVKEEEKAEEQTVQSTSTMPDKDTEYLKKNDTWKMSDASSSEAKSLLGAFGSGNIDAIIGANAYNSLQENKRNGYYNKIVNDLKKIKRQSNVEDAKAALRDACKNGTVNLKAVQDRMHRMLK